MVKIIVLDIETTHFLPRSGIICEIGLCWLNLKTGKITRIFDTICQEKNKYIDPNAWVFKNSDLKYKDVLKAPFLDDFKNKLQKVFDTAVPVTAFNQQFDFTFLVDRGFKIYNRTFDPMLELTNILKIRNYYGYKWPSVQEAWNYFFKDSDYVEKHRAIDDAIHEAKIVYETYKLIKKDEE